MSMFRIFMCVTERFFSKKIYWLVPGVAIIIIGLTFFNTSLSGPRVLAVPGEDVLLRASSLCSIRSSSTTKCSLRQHSTLGVNSIEKYIYGVHQKIRNITLVSPARIRTGMMLAVSSVFSCAPGDFVETGVFTGGSTASLMRVLLDFDNCNRKLWAFDSFEGLPNIVPQDSGVGSRGMYSSSLDNFARNLKSVGSWDGSRIVIRKGWFNETIPLSIFPAGISFLRLDGDLYQSTRDALEGLYPHVLPGGFIYIDDYRSFPGCARAVDEYRMKRNITDPLNIIPEMPSLNLKRFASKLSGNYEAVWWRKSKASQLLSV